MQVLTLRQNPHLISFHNQCKSTLSSPRTLHQTVNCTISDFLLEIQTLNDALTAIGKTVSTKEHLDIIVDGLLEEDESFVSIIRNRFHKYTIDEVETLLAQEARLDKFKKKRQ